MATRVEVPQITIEEFVRLYEQQPFELIDGEQIPLSPTVQDHNVTTSTMFRLLILDIHPKALGEVFVEAPFVLEYSKNWVKGSRTPDLMFVNAQRLAAYREANPDWRNRPLVLVPDLAIEIVSQNDSYSDVEAKAEGYLRDGVRLVWIFDPQRKKIAVREAGSNMVKILSIEDMLIGGEVIPGFEAAVKAIFE